MADGRKILLLSLMVTGLWMVLAGELSFGREKYDFIHPEDNSIQVILIPSKDTISVSDTLFIKVLILNTGGLNLILADIWEDESLNVVFSYTDDQGKEIEFLSDKNAPNSWFIARNPRPSTLVLGPEEFWGFTLGFLEKVFPKNGSYYFQVNYRGTSPDFIEKLIKERRIKRSMIDAPFNKYWHGEAKSNKVKVVVRK